MKIDCTRCEMYDSGHCEDCLVTALLHPPSSSLDIDDDLEAPLGALGDAGLVPVLKFRRRGDEGAREGPVGPDVQGQAGPEARTSSAASG